MNKILENDIFVIQDDLLYFQTFKNLMKLLTKQF